MLFHSGQEPGYGLHKRVIVHHSIPFPAVQPVRGIPVMLGNDQGVRIGGFHPFPEILPEFVVALLAVSQVCRDIQPPSVNAVRRGHPFLGNLQDLFPQFRRALVVQFRQRGVAPPAFICGGPAVAGIVEVEVAPVRAVHTLESARQESGFPEVDALVVHPLVEGSTVVEHAVQDNPHTAPVHFLAQPGEQLVALLQVLRGRHPANIPGRESVMLLPQLHFVFNVIRNHAEVGIHMLVILCVVLMA